MHHHRSILELKRQVYGETYQEIEATENQIRSEQRNRESILEELKKCELEIVEDEQQIQLIRERIRDHYDEEKLAHYETYFQVQLLILNFL